MRCLVLNSSFEFLGFTDHRGAISAAYTNKAIVMEEYEQVFHSPTMEMRVPAVIRLRHYVKVAYEKLRFVSYTKRNVHLRDNYTCQYCGIKPMSHKLGIDHVIPESKGGLTSWDNTVSACYPCNSDKGDKTLQESGMKLIRIPRKPGGFREIIRIKIGAIHDLWIKYLY